MVYSISILLTSTPSNQIIKNKPPKAPQKPKQDDVSKRSNPNQPTKKKYNKKNKAQITNENNTAVIRTSPRKLAHATKKISIDQNENSNIVLNQSNQSNISNSSDVSSESYSSKDI
jgi:hypothetical protein